MNRTELTGDQLRQFVERIERLEEEEETLRDDKKSVYHEAKTAGFNPKAVKLIIKERKQNPHEVEEQEAILSLYRQALGMPGVHR